MSSSAGRPRRRNNARLSLASSVLDLPGVGSRRQEILRSLGIETVGDLLNYPPARHIDRQAFARIANLRPGEVQTVAGRIQSVDVKFIRGKRMTVATVSDGSGNLRCVWFSQPYLRRAFKQEAIYVFSGAVRLDKRGPSMVHPEYELAESELLHTGRIVPVYRTRAGLSQKQLRKLVRRALEACADGVEDHLPNALARDLNLGGLAGALRDLHFPPDLGRVEAARRRLAFDELLLFQTLFALARRERKHMIRSAPGGPGGPDREGRRAGPDLIARITSRLPFRLTESQAAALVDIAKDLDQPYPVRRLIQGDVGCGKTVVAALAAAIVAGSGRQVAVLCPTELLADQHFTTFTRFLNPLGFEVGLVTGSAEPGGRSKTEEALREGALPVVVGTHALLGNGLLFKSLGLVIVDEEQRFGVLQRTGLLRHAPAAGLVVVSATPIPRTLALTAYGDLDVTVITGMPPGRGTHTTRVVPEEGTCAANLEIAEKINSGMKGFYVCPALEEGSADLVDVRRVRAEMQQLVGRARAVEILTGQTGREERARVLRGFKEGTIGLIVATTVVEVGMDIPSATVLAVAQAERFGLSQLHQMRGRVARSGEPSFSYFMVSQGASEKAWARLRALESTCDGFEIAERDLYLRGPGELAGTRQHGIPDLKFASLADDLDLVGRARREAFTNVLADAPSPDWRAWIDAARKRMEGSAQLV